MGNNIGIDVAYAAPGFPLLAASSLEVRERAVTLRDARGQVRPATGGTGFRMSTTTWSFLSAGDKLARRGVGSTGVGSTDVSVMDNVRISKPCTGYHATRGTG